MHNAFCALFIRSYYRNSLEKIKQKQKQNEPATSIKCIQEGIQHNRYSTVCIKKSGYTIDHFKRTFFTLYFCDYELVFTSLYLFSIRIYNFSSF